MSKLNKLVDTYLLENPKKDGEIGYYKKVGDIFGMHPENVRTRYRFLRSVGQKLGDRSIIDVDASSLPDTPHPISKTGLVSVSNNFVHLGEIQPNNFSTTYTHNGGYIEGTSSNKIEDLDDLIRVCNIDTTKNDVTTYEVKAYNAWIKNKNNEIEAKQLYSVRAQLKTKKIDTDNTLQKTLILDEIKKYSPYGNIGIVYAAPQKVERVNALEINIPDLHIGKLAWDKEAGEDYDIKVAVERYTKAVEELLSRVNLSIVEKIILPVGNDLINVDNAGNTTTAGTPVSCDSRFGKMFQSAKTLLIETIEKLSTIAPVDVIIIPGNHDSISTFTLGEVLDAWFHTSPYVNVINTHTPRKYYQYGQNLIMYTHGHREKLNDLGIICATEQPKLWAATKYRRVHVGHFHHSKQIKFTDVQEFPGFTVKILNSLSSNDAWHAEKGFLSLKGAEAFLYHKDKGLVANYYYLNS